MKSGRRVGVSFQVLPGDSIKLLPVRGRESRGPACKVAKVSAATDHQFDRSHKPLLDYEEQILAHAIVQGGRIAEIGGIDRAEFRRVVGEQLQFRRYQRQKMPGTKRPVMRGKIVEYDPRVIKLNANAIKILDGDNGCSDKFIRAFYARWKGVLAQTTRITNDIAREARLVFSVAEEHLDKLDHELKYLPTPRLDPQGNLIYLIDPTTKEIMIDVASGQKICETEPCSEGLAILNPKTNKFQCGDPVFYAVIDKIRGDLRDLQGDVQRQIDELKTVPPAGLARVEAELKKSRKAVEVKAAYLRAAEAECERRGRARFMNEDEMPSAISFVGSAGSKRRVGAAAGERPVQGVAENKEQFSVHPTVDANGKWGPLNILLEQTDVTQGVIPEQMMLDHTGIIVQHTEHGIQTGASFLEYNKRIDSYLDEERNSVFGKWKVTRPVVTCEDGHASRYDPAVMTYRRKKKIRSFIEEGGTSGVFQLLDQLFKGCHEDYLGHCDAIRFRMGPTYRISKFEAMQIMCDMFPPSGDGGCNPTWVTTNTVIKCLRHVGVTWSGISFQAMKKNMLRDDTADKGAAAAAADVKRLACGGWGEVAAGAVAATKRSATEAFSPKTPGCAEAAAAATPATTVEGYTLDDVEDITAVSEKAAAIAAWKMPWKSDHNVAGRRYAQVRKRLGFGRIIVSEVLGNILRVAGRYAVLQGVERQAWASPRGKSQRHRPQLDREQGVGEGLLAAGEAAGP